VTPEEAIDRIATEQLFTVHEAAAAIHVSPWTIRQWVTRGHLEPVPGFQLQTFFETDVYACQTQRRSAKHAGRVSDLGSLWRAVQ
jgi:hypothetical protein